MATSSPESTQNLIVGHLFKKCSNGQQTCYHHQRVIYADQELLVGRDAAICKLHTNDPTISRRHLKIYAIVYDEDEKTDIQPLVYAANLSSRGIYWNGSYVSKGQGGILLSENDELKLSPSLTLTFSTKSDPDDVGGGYRLDTMGLDNLDFTQHREIQSFNKSYRITSRKLGAGAHASVFMAVKLDLGKQLACKIVDLRSIRRKEKKRLIQLAADKEAKKGRYSSISSTRSKRQSSEMAKQIAEGSVNKIAREVEILKNVSHANIIRLDKVFRSNNTIYIFEELITGGDLFSYLMRRGGSLDEAEGGVIVIQILQALKHLHEHEIVHRDVKPENILVASIAEAARIVLSDFGSAVYLPNRVDKKIARMFSLAGTDEYAAPEVVGQNKAVQEKGYTKAVDMWSVGCVTTVILTGSRPFSWTSKMDNEQSSQQAIDEAIRDCKLDGLGDVQEWQHLSGFPKDFVSKLLVLDENVRLTAKQALSHAWFTNDHFREDFIAVYRKAISGWQKNILPPDAIENIVGYRPVEQGTIVLRQKLKKQTPIEPHYQPCHRNVNHQLFPKPVRRPTLWEMRKLNEKTKPVVKQNQFGRAGGVVDNKALESKLDADKDKDKDKDSQASRDHNTQNPSGSSPKRAQRDEPNACETQEFPQTPTKQVLHDKHGKSELWYPPSSQKRMSLDVAIAKPDRGRLGTPTKSTLRLPSRSPIRRTTGGLRPKGHGDDLFNIEDSEGDLVVPDSPYAEQTTSKGSTLSSTEWSVVNRRQPMRLGSFPEASAEGQAPITNCDNLKTQRPRQAAPSLDPRIEIGHERAEAVQGSLKKRAFPNDDYVANTKRQRVSESLGDSPSDAPRSIVLTVNTIGTDDTGQISDSPNDGRNSPPADLTDSIRTAY